MNQIIKQFLILSFLLVGSSGFAQSLSELINIALENNYQIRIINNQLIQAENNNTAGNAGQLPTLDLTGSVSNSSNNTYLQFADGSVTEGKNAKTTNINVSLLADWTIFSGFSILAKKEQLNQLVQLGQLNSSYYIEQTVSDIVAAYYQIVFQKKLLKTYQSSLVISRYRYTLEKAKKAVGSGEISMYGQAFVDYNTDSINYLKQLNIIDNLAIEMNQLINSDLNQKINIEDIELKGTILSSQDSLLNKAKQNNQSLAQSLILEQIQATQMRISKADRFPTIGIYAGYNIANNNAEVGFIQQNRNLGPQIGLTVSYNLFNGGQTNTAIKNSSLDLENSTLNKMDTEVAVNAEILKAVQDYKSLNTQREIAVQNAQMMRNVNKVAIEKLKEGSMNGYDFRQSQLSLLNAEQILINISYAQKLIEVNLHQLTGNVVNTFL